MQEIISKTIFWPKPAFFGLNTIMSATIHEKFKQKHILESMMSLIMFQSSSAQQNFLQTVELLASTIRGMLDAGGLIHKIDIDHKKAWSEVKGKKICFVDGGVANFSGIGAEPIAVRIGTYTVVPGDTSEKRENFNIEKQLVAELFEPHSDDGVFEDLFEDTSKLRDAARITLEVAAGVHKIKKEPDIDFLVFHGALVNPVSAYGVSDFPNFSESALHHILAETKTLPKGINASFVSVYLNILNELKSSKINIASVVERTSSSKIVSNALLDELNATDLSPGPGDIQAAKKKLAEFRIPDWILFQAILNEGEYLQPVTVDRNTESKQPQYSKHIISRYPKPQLTYVGVGEFAPPLRVEFFNEPPAGYDCLLRLIVHSCRLMPQYAFPVGLDIVDKFAKIPQWMSSPLNSALAVSVLKKALDSKDPNLIDAAKKMLCGTKRDFLFRPSFKK